MDSKGVAIFQLSPLKTGMNQILKKEKLAKDIKRIRILAPQISKKALPGQFVIVRTDETGERIPLTIHSSDPEAGTISLVFLEIGKSTIKLGQLKEGDTIHDVAGPLGRPSEIERYGTCIAVGGGVGSACVYPVAMALKEEGNYLISITGAKTKELVIMEEDFGEISDELYITTDDGSYGVKGFVTTKLEELLESGRQIDYVYAVGPAIMMKAVADTTRPYSVKTTVSLNPIMVDGTGMCGGCRVEVGGETRFACVDGPEFDAHQVDFDLLLKRQRFYVEEERCQLEEVA
jgi:ferredoxin--NADP+ reductase